jgi:hypothetical protein
MNNSMSNLPWVERFLTPIQNEYGKAPPSYKLVQPTNDDISYVLSHANEIDPFDTGRLKRDTGEALLKGEAELLKCSSPGLGTILVVRMREAPFHPPWNTWWRAVRLLTHPVRIVIFAHPRRRETPPIGQNVEKEHVNGGAAMRCDPKSIVIYRKEEATRVLIHELFHATCSDPYHKETPQIEADTEAWAEMLLCGMAARGRVASWIKHMRQQIDWSVRQAATVRDRHNVHSFKDYSWRYLVGRLEVWRRLGIPVPSIPNQYEPVKSLRFTICEPKDI